MIAIRLNSFQIVAILFVLANLVGCQTAEPQKVIPIKNEEKDKYIEKIEGIVSESVSAITAVLASLPAGIPKEILESQATRLGGVSKPTVEGVGRYTQMVKQNDSKAVQKDKEEASKVDSETNALWAMVEDRDKELDSAKLALAQVQEERKIEFKQKILWALSCLGMAVSTGGLMVIAFTPFKIRGLILIAGGAMAVSAVWVLDSEWFKYILITVAVIFVLDIVYVLTRMLVKKTTP